MKLAGGNTAKPRGSVVPDFIVDLAMFLKPIAGLAMWLVPGLLVFLFALIGIALMYVGMLVQVCIILFVILYLVSLLVLSEIYGKIVISSPRKISGTHGGPSKMRHATLYFISQLLIGPCVAWMLPTILGVLIKS